MTARRGTELRSASLRIAELVSGVLLAVTLSGCSASSTPEATPVPTRLLSKERMGPVLLTVHLAPEVPRFLDRLRLELIVDGGTTARIEELDLGARCGHLRIRGHASVGEDPHRRTLRVDAEAERTGTNIVRFPDIVFTIESGEGAGERRVFRPTPVELEVAGLPPAERASLEALAGPLPPLALPRDRSWRNWALAIGAALLAVGGGAGFLWSRRRRVVLAAAPIDPTAEARAAFERLLASDWLPQRRYPDFYVELTAIVRRFVERTTGVDAPDRTTEEFLRAMEHHEAFPEPRRQALTAFLESADLVKFAALVPSAAEIEGAVSAAQRFCGLDERRDPAS